VADNPSQPMPPGSVDGVKTMQITGSGSKEFGIWSYTQEGVYFYRISEVNTGARNYVYDTTVYTITDTVTAVDGQLKLSRVVTNGSNRQVTSLDFINTYTSGGLLNPPALPVLPPLPPNTSGTSTGGTNTGGVTTGGGSAPLGPKTGDESQDLLFASIFCAGAVIALGSAAFLFFERRKKAVISSES